ncbi:MAG: spermidine/putrescine transport system ATP-binding protein [bacterium]|nr:MAG: spermidine/putrescine transport system ATP-binding protein [bacterium]KAF0148123.1 MAG: spermidine/putrescine transport system ATP-binding protein [bacterium]KAF0167611.1 MAG: spermidine/putrescine transport system ATP-binding protein [bacterium]TXT17733.1 MAG: spermidine/putrescine transport system ATP-binding protein [bacterium]
MPLLEIRRVTRRFGAFEAVKEVSFGVEAGEFFTLLGPSGCGKTTLLRMIAGFDLPDAGQILLDGKDLAHTPAERRPVHTVFQNFALFPHLTVAKNVAFPLRMAGLADAEIRRRTAEALDMVHLGELAEHYPNEISGGQKQRVALARGLVNRPRLLLLDEPLGALDLKLREEMQMELIKLQREVGITFVFVTHAQNEALALSHRIAVMNAGRVVQLDAPSRIYGFPASRFVADFIGNCNLLEAEVRAVEAGRLRLHVAGLGEIVAPAAADIQSGERGLLALRPEQVRIAAEADPGWANRFPGEVRDFLYVGDVTTYQVLLDNGYTLQALMPNAAPGRARFHETGDRVMVGWPAEAGHYVRD